MSDVQRLMAAAEKSPALAEKLSTLEPEALARWASSEGYRLTLDEAKSVCSSFQELSEDDLEQVAGGWDGNSGGGGVAPPGP